MALFIPTYFAPIAQYSVISQCNSVTFEFEDNFQKQTYRNRCYIYGANGKLSLNIPVKHKHSENRKKTKDALIENDFPWQIQHFKSLQSAYRTSPFFEFYEDDIHKIFSKKYSFLHDVVIDTHLFVTDALQISNAYTKTSSYSSDSSEKDFRNLAIAKKGVEIEMDTYVQMFDDKFGFIPNLSILDLLFMEGPNAISFLQKISLILK
ncbi:WbqC family protein [Tenacibaculum sp. nBUS_03]|uniref:WbqC family protein n=1 Tax=Tenacibaculum sp. nBUS_03 TaxID=3395320 RepID=UPI003EBC7BA0